MGVMRIEKPVLVEPLKYQYTVSAEDMERFRRKKQRAKDLGIEMFVLDEKEMPEELEELENYIIDNFLEMDLEVPDDIKRKYLDMKQEILSGEKS